MIPLGRVAVARDAPPVGVASAVMAAVVVEPLIAVDVSVLAAKPSASSEVNTN